MLVMESFTREVTVKPRSETWDRANHSESSGKIVKDHGMFSQSEGQCVWSLVSIMEQWHIMSWRRYCSLVCVYNRSFWFMCRLEGGRSGCAETNLEATVGPREGWCSLKEGAVKTQGGWEVGVQSSLGGKIDSVWWLGLQEREASGRCFRFWLAQLDEERGHSWRGKPSGACTYFLHSSTRRCDSPILGAILLCKCLTIAVSKGVGVTLLGNDKMAALSFLPLLDPALSPGKWLRGWHQSPLQHVKGMSF